MTNGTNLMSYAFPVALAVTAGVGVGAAYVANRLDPDGGANKGLTVGTGITAGATGLGAIGFFIAASKAGGDFGGIGLALIGAGLGVIALGTGAFAAGSLGADLLDLGQKA